MSSRTLFQSSGAASQDAASYLDASRGALVAPAGQEGVSGWVFDVPDSERLELTADITDHFVESGSFVNDHIVRKPVRITLSGFVGELVYVVPKPTGVLGALQTLQGKLGVVDAFLGDLTPQAVQDLRKSAEVAQAVAGQAQALVARGKNLVGAFREGDEPDRQTAAWLALKALWQTGQVVTVQTPWEYYDSMLIEMLAAEQDDSSSTITNITIMLKEARFADVQTVEYKQDLEPPRSEVQATKPADLGTVTGSAVEDKGPLLLAVEGLTGKKLQ